MKHFFLYFFALNLAVICYFLFGDLFFDVPIGDKFIGLIICLVFGGFSVIDYMTWNKY